MHLISGLVMAEMVLDCWIGAEVVSFIKAVKFLELAGSNLVAVTNLAICTNLALIVHVSINRIPWYFHVFLEGNAAVPGTSTHTRTICTRYVYEYLFMSIVYYCGRPR